MDDTTQPPKSITRSETSPGLGDTLALVLIWSRDEPGRAGEALVIPAGNHDSAWTFGRDVQRTNARSIGLVRQRPGGDEPTKPLACPRISRAQLRLSMASRERLRVENVGRCALVRDGVEVSSAEVVPGDVLELRHELVFLCVSRPRVFAPMPPDAQAIHRFGEPDAFGLVGEGPVMWDLRRAALALAGRPAHVLVRGPSGSGKELVARAMHAGSPRRHRPLVARNAATLPEGLIDAELFGNAKGYPNPGSAERPGLIGEADGGTLFLDEFAELPSSLQAHLLRVLDEGEYHRLGEARARRSDLRLIAATNRPEEALKHDVLARLQGRLVLPGLDAHREDIPLLVAHLMRRQAQETPALLGRFFQNDELHAAPRTTPELMTALVRHPYQTHIRELDALLLQASIESRGKYLELTESVHRALEKPSIELAPAADLGPVEGLGDEEQRRVALFRKHGFSVAACARDPEYRASRQTADLHFRQLMSRALAIGAWDVGEAVSILAGSDPSLQSTVRSRVEGFLLNLRHRLDAEGSEALGRSLAAEWRASASVALRLIEALEAKRIRGSRG